MVRSLTLYNSKTVHFLTLCLLTFSIETMKTTILQSLIKIDWDSFHVHFVPGPFKENFILSLQIYKYFFLFKWTKNASNII